MNKHASMNRIYRLIWSDARNTWVPVGELTSARGKRSQTARAAVATALLLATGGTFAAEPAVGTLPSGGQVIRGNASITQSDARMDIHQSSDRTVIDWQRFDIGRDATVSFWQPSSTAVTLNRVLSSDPSAIFGRLNANGQVFISNPNGVLFGSSARADVGGLVATSLRIDPDDFIRGNFRFTGGGGAVVNQGILTATDGGYLALMAPEVRNEGVLSARLGTVAMAAGEAVTLNLDGDRLLSVQVDPATLDTLVENRHLIAADGGQVILSASAAQRLVDGAIPGATGATRLVVENGEARLVNVEGTVRAATVSIDGGATGVTRVAGTIQAQTSAGDGGHVLVTGDKVHIDAGATLDASGKSGGTILIGGDQQGANPNVRNAQRLFVDASAAIHADGGANADRAGDGGRVIAYSTQSSQVYGALTARGGAAGGDGGFIETSGGYLDVGSRVPDASAAAGKAGQWLIDPYNITINSAGPNSGIGGDPNWTSTADNAVLSTGSIEAALNAGTSVTITTGAGGAGDGDINVLNSIHKSAGGDASLSLFAHRHIIFGSGVTLDSSSGALDVLLNSNQDGSGDGGIFLAANTVIDSNGGDILLRGGVPAFTSAIADPTSDPNGFASQLLALGGVSNDTVVRRYGVHLTGATLDAGGGNIEVRGAGASGYSGIQVENGSQIITSGGGTVALYGLGGSGGTDSNGVRINGASTRVATENGALSIFGLGRGANCAVTDCSEGIQIDNSAVVESVNGAIDLRGASIGTHRRARGIWLNTAGTVRTTGLGNIGVLGRGGGVGDHGVGVHLNAASVIRTTGGGSIAVTGYGSSVGTSDNNEGVKIDASTVEVQTGAGSLTVVGTAGPGNAYNIGVNVRMGGAIRQAGSGDMVVQGTGGSGVTGNWGILLEENAIYESTGSGDLTLIGIGGTGSDNSGIRVTGGMNNRIGSATMTGDITLQADSMNLAAGATNGLIVRSSGSLYIRPHALNTTIGLGGAVGTLSLDTAELSRFVDGFHDIVIGNYGGTGRISTAALTLNDPLQLQNMGAGSAGILIGGILNVGSNALTLASHGAVTQTARIAAGQLMLFGNGAYTLTNVGNDVGTLAGTLGGDLHYVNNGSFAVGSVQSGYAQFDGLSSTGGTLRLEARGSNADLTLDRALSAGGAGTSIELSAEGAFINQAGANALQTSAGRALVWAGDRARTDLGGLAFDFKQYRATYGVGTPAQLTGDGLLFQDAPLLVVGLNHVSRTYDGTTHVTFDANDFNITGALDGDVVTLTSDAGQFDTKDAGTGKTVTVSNVAIGSASNGSMAVYGYELASTTASGNGDVTPKALTITAADATRVEGQPDPAFDASFDGFVAGEDASVFNGSLAFATTANSSSPAGTYGITASGVTASNYSISYQSGTLTVTPAAQPPQQPEVPNVPEIPTQPETPTVPQLPETPSLPEPTPAPTPSPEAERIGQLVTPQNPERVVLASADRTLALREPTARNMIVDGGISLGSTAPAATTAQSTTVWGGFISAEPLDAVKLGSTREVMFQLSKDTFRHSNTQEQVRLSAQVAGGGALPDSLHFDPTTGILSGTLPAGHPGLVIVFIAQDAVGGEASTRLEIRP